MPPAYPRELREDVIRVARSRGPGARLKDISNDFGISESCLQYWLAQADRDDGARRDPRASSSTIYARPEPGSAALGRLTPTEYESITTHSQHSPPDQPVIATRGRSCNCDRLQ